MLKFNVDGAPKGKPGPAGIGNVLCNHNGLGTKDFNEAEVMAILEALWIFLASFQGKLTVESDSLTNAVK